MRLYPLEGKVECSTGAQTSRVDVGEMTAMTGSSKIEVQPFTAWDIPAFGQEEVEADSGLAVAVLDVSGLDALHPEEPEPG